MRNFKYLYFTLLFLVNISVFSLFPLKTSSATPPDTTDPVVDITNPLDTSIVGGVVDVRASVSDLNLFKYRVGVRDLTSLAIIEDLQVFTSTSFTDTSILSWDTTGLLDGPYRVFVRGKDVAGNETLVRHNVTVDNTDPFVAITNPDDGDTVSGPVDVRGTATDTNIRGYRLTIRDLSTLPAMTIVENTGFVPSGNIGPDTTILAGGWDTTGVHDGDYRIAFLALDWVGNDTIERIEVTVDNGDPAVTVDPVASTVGSPKLTGTVSDTAASVTVVVDGLTYIATNNGDGTWTLPAGTISPKLSTGIYDVSATATDLNGDEGYDATVDELSVAIPSTGGSTGETTSTTGTTSPATGDNTVAFGPVAQTLDDNNDEEEEPVDGNTGDISSTSTDGEGETQGEKTESEGGQSWFASNWPWLLALLLALFLIFFWARRRDDDEEEA